MTYLPQTVRNRPIRSFVGKDREEGYLHWHSEMELLICLCGHMTVRVEEHTYPLREGDAILIPGYAAHSGQTDCKECRRVALTFGHALLRNEYAAMQNTFLLMQAGEGTLPRSIRQPLEQLRLLFTDRAVQTEQDQWRIQAYLLLFCAGVREWVPAQQPTADLQARARRFEIIYDILEYVEENYKSKITVEQMADLCGYAPSYFSKQFKQITGLSFYRYLTCYRISVACGLLDDPRYNLSHIARMTGFSTQPLFCRAFKEVTSMTPKQFQALPPEEKNMTWIN